MFIQLQSLKNIIATGVELDRNEIIRRYRLQSNYNKHILTLLCMLPFFKIYRNNNGDIELV